jgi:hypothetical protein
MPSLSSLVPRIAPNQLDTTDITETNAILVHGEAASMRSREERLADRGGDDRETSTIGARPDSTTWCDRLLTYGVDQEQTQQRWLRLQLWLRSIASELRQLEVEREVGNDQRLNVDEGVGGYETSNVEVEAGCECRVINRGKVSTGTGK